MTRILADLPEDDIRWLDARAAEQGKSRASVLRDAVAAYRSDAPGDWLEAGFGAWKDRTDIGDAVEWQRRERAGSTRPWDIDYPEVRAEFPDLFDAEDDREYERHKAWLAEHDRKPEDGLGWALDAAASGPARGSGSTDSPERRDQPSAPAQHSGQ